MSYNRNPNTADEVYPLALHDTAYGDGNGDGYGDGYGDGNGDGYGYGKGDGYGYGYGGIL